MVEAKAKAKATKFCPRGVLEVEASPRGTPSLGFLPRNATQRTVMPRHLSVHHSQRPTAASCACVLSIVFMVLRPLLINHIGLLKNSTSYGQSLKPKPRPRIVEAKAKGLQGQGHKILSSRSRPVLEDPHPSSIIIV